MRKGWILVALLVLLASCSRDASERDGPPDKVKVVVSIPPQAYFVERVGGDHVAVEVLADSGQSPHAFEPTPRQMVSIAQARVYFLIGLPFEQQLTRRIGSSFENITLADTRARVPLRHLTKPRRHGAGKGPQTRQGQVGDHADDDMDPHIWLDPKLVKIQANTICRALGELDPVHADDYSRNLVGFQADLDRVDAKIAKALSPFRGREFLVFHPAFGYFGASYGLRQRAVEIGGAQPGPKRVGELIEYAKEHGIKVMFVQRQFSRKAAETLAREIGGAVVPMDPLARDYIRNLEDMAEKITAALEHTSG